ncbi:DoxX family protein [uncultured Chitinophaga sp.]|uniref:DoxX family protein n=1 Tax=uncultured Chitinophaga sp. TaxID=339340 RepID=UPI0025E8817C|nr:DoxX family protein [uncultured Chitinophaga sp.]
MKPKTLNILYWSFTIFFALLLIMDGIGGLSGSEDGKVAMRQLGYPEYIMPITGVAKLLAAIAILQNKFITIKEWAFAGLTFNFIMAAVSWAIVGQPLFFVLFPLIVLAIMLVPYFLWKKVMALKAAGVLPNSTQPFRAAYSA